MITWDYLAKKNKKSEIKVKAINAATNKQLERKINKFGKTHEIVDVTGSSTGTQAGHSVIVKYK